MILIPMGGLAWAYFAGVEYTRRRHPVIFGLATAAILGIFLP